MGHGWYGSTRTLTSHVAHLQRRDGGRGDDGHRHFAARQSETSTSLTALTAFRNRQRVGLNTRVVVHEAHVEQTNIRSRPLSGTYRTLAPQLAAPYPIQSFMWLRPRSFNALCDARGHYRRGHVTWPPLLELRGGWGARVLHHLGRRTTYLAGLHSLSETTALVASSDRSAPLLGERHIRRTHSPGCVLVAPLL